MNRSANINFLRLTSLCKMSRGWWSQITGSHYMTALFSTSVTWDLSGQFSCSFCASLSNFHDRSLFLPSHLLLKALHSLLKYLANFNFYADFQRFPWSVACEPQCPPFCLPWLYLSLALVLIPYSSNTFQQSYSLSIPWMT